MLCFDDYMVLGELIESDFGVKIEVLCEFGKEYKRVLRDLREFGECDWVECNRFYRVCVYGSSWFGGYVGDYGSRWVGGYVRWYGLGSYDRFKKMVKRIKEVRERLKGDRDLSYCKVEYVEGLVKVWSVWRVIDKMEGWVRVVVKEWEKKDNKEEDKERFKKSCEYWVRRWEEDRK